MEHIWYDQKNNVLFESGINPTNISGRYVLRFSGKYNKMYYVDLNYCVYLGVV